MNNRGFNLIDLMFITVVIGLVLIYSIPEINEKIYNSKKLLFHNEAMYFLNSVKDNIDIYDPVDDNSFRDVPFCEVSREGSMKHSPFSVDWVCDKSFARIKKTEGNYYFYVQLLDEKGYLFPYTEMYSLNQELLTNINDNYVKVLTINESDTELKS